MHLINSIPGYIILLCGTDIISVTIFIQFFENLPNSLDESAIMDGCTYFGVFFKILLPLLKPAIVTVMILKGVGTYNEYYMANLYLQDKSRLVTVATSLYKFTGPLGNQYNYICAGVIITLLPAIDYLYSLSEADLRRTCCRFSKGLMAAVLPKSCNEKQIYKVRGFVRVQK